MKKITLLLMLLCIAVGAQAQLLWKISGKDLTRPSYVVGTHHLAPLSIVDKIAGFRQTLEAVDEVCGEVVMADMMAPENMLKFQKGMMLPAGKTLKTVLTKPQYDSVAMVVKKLAGVDLAVFDAMKPAVVNTQLALLITMRSLEGFNPQEQLDGWIQQEAAQKGKAVRGFETVDFQIGVLYDSQSLERQSELLYYLATHLDENIAKMERLNKAYLSQDLKNLQAVVEEKMNNEGDSRPEEEATLIYDRNANWAKAMPDMMRDRSILFAVGCAHLTGERGLLQLLKNEGYTVEPVKE